MPVLQSHPGSWSVAGFRLPDFGITERLSSNRTAQGGSNVFGGGNSSYAQSVPSTSNVLASQSTGQLYGPYAPASASRPTGGGGGGGAPFGTDQQVRDINQTTNDLGSQIDREYEIALGDLSGQEQSLRAQAGTSEQAVQNQGNKAKSSLGQSRDMSLQEVSGQESQVNKQSNSAMQQARDLYRQIQQQNVAQLSGMGLSSSSVAEAMAERLGVETARRLAGVTGSRDEVLNNLSTERRRINDVFTQKTAQLEDDLRVSISEIQNELMAGINRINTAKQTASSDKSARRADLFRNAQSAIFDVQQRAASYSSALAQKAQQRQADVEEWQKILSAQNPDTSGFQGALNSVPGLSSAGSFAIGGQPQAMSPEQAYFLPGQQQRRPEEFDFAQYGL